MTMYREYYFDFNGFTFVSSVDTESTMYQSIKRMPEEMFIQMNLACLTELLADTPMEVNAIRNRLEKMNEGGSYAFISLGENHK